MFQNLCFKAFSPFALCRDVIIFLSLPPSLLLEVDTSPLPPQTHPENILPKTHMAHEVNPLGLAVLSPGKSDAADHSSASFQGLQQSCDVCFPLRIYPINLFAYFTATM